MKIQKWNRMPARWGGGQLIAFSGVDGTTVWGRSLIFHSGPNPGEFRLLLPVELSVAFGDGRMDWPAGSWLTGDVVVDGVDRYTLQLLAADAVGGSIASQLDLWVGEQTVRSGETTVVAATETGFVAVARSADSWALVFQATESTAREAALRCLENDWAEVRANRTEFLERVLAPYSETVDPDYRELLAKALSVMKVNTESADREFPHRWSTPDRWPHRAMWLWDSAFHAIAMNHFEPALAEDFLRSILERGDGDGFIPHYNDPTGNHSAITQPPILGWALLELWKKGRFAGDISELLDRNVRFLQWCQTNRDRNGNHLLEWDIEGNPLCRSGESGLDNSPRFDRAVLMDAVDFSSFLAHDYNCCATIADSLGQANLARDCRSHAEAVAGQINALLWNEESGFYQDRLMDGSLVDVNAVSGFMPLFAGVASKQQAAALVKHLNDPTTFGAAMPVPSVSLDTGTFCKDMWRGPSWINTNYLVVEGLRRYGYIREATAIRERVLREVNRWYVREGCFFEYYDSLSATSPRNLDRKQRLSLGKGMAPITDFHWSAALTAAWIVEPVI